MWKGRSFQLSTSAQSTESRVITVCTDDADDDGGEDWAGEDWSDGGYEDAPDDDEPTACPECGAAMSGHTDKCPRCGYWVTDEDRRVLRPGSKRPTWQRAVAALFILGFLLLLLLAGISLF
jgi:hypothetical protein